MSPWRLWETALAPLLDMYSEKEGSFAWELMQVKSGLHFKIFTKAKVERVGIPIVKVMCLKTEGIVDGTYLYFFFNFKQLYST